MENVIINADFRTKEIIIAEIKTVYANIHETAFWGSIRIGQGLKELKQLIPHGELTDYIQDNLGFSPRKFQQYVQFNDQYGDEKLPRTLEQYQIPHTYADLNFSNALRLLTVPEDQVEDFVIENDVTDMTAKELEQKIKELHSEKDRTKELEGKLNSAITDRDAYIKRENDLVDQINSLQESVKSNGSEKNRNRN